MKTDQKFQSPEAAQNKSESKGVVKAIMKNSKAYDELKEQDEIQKRQNASNFIDHAGVEMTEVYTISDNSFVHSLSSFVQASDASFVEFALFCC